MPLSEFPNELIIYCGVCAFLAVTFCCCFHVTELVKLRNLKKFTDPRRYSLSAISDNVLFESVRSSSLTRETTAMIDPTFSPDSSIITDNGTRNEGNFSIITVLTYTVPPLRGWEQCDKLRKTLLPPKGEVPVEVTQGLKVSIPSKDGCMITISSDTNGSGRELVSKKQDDIMLDKPPVYDRLFPEVECVK